MATSDKTDKPQLRVYTLVPREDEAPFWLHIGWAYHNKDGNGMTLRLQALPMNDKLVVREYHPDDVEGSDLAAGQSGGGAKPRAGAGKPAAATTKPPSKTG